jgi:hypothetical protein
MLLPFIDLGVGVLSFVIDIVSVVTSITLRDMPLTMIVPSSEGRDSNPSLTGDQHSDMPTLNGMAEEGSPIGRT